jgi:FAD/FMN-containing dehydrogenase
MTPQIAACKTALAAYDLEDRVAIVRQKSRDFYWYSPVLKRQLDDVIGDFVVTPRSEAEVREILAICWAHDVPVTTRGAGTGNYGQAMPLSGGAIMHMRNLDKVTEIADRHVVCQSGTVIADLEQAVRAEGREIRLFPSTTSSATIGGFIAGGSSGVGAIRWGGLRNLRNINRVKLVTMEQVPRSIELTGADISKAAHAYGVNGVITELELPIDPAVDWVDVIIRVDSFAHATTLAIALGEAPAIDKRMLSTFEAPIGQRYFKRYRPYIVDGEALILMMVAAESLPALVDHLAGIPHATLRFRQDRHRDGDRLPALYEMAWNHTTLRAMKVDPTITYLQTMFQRDTALADIARVKARFGDELLLHLEFTRIGDVVMPVAMPLVRFTTEERLEAIIVDLEAMGLAVFNPHRVTLEEGGMKRTDANQLAFKRQADPKGLLNPGKMIAWTQPDWTPTPGKTFLFN